jgi:preprotein translocase subunit YajC
MKKYTILFLSLITQFSLFAQGTEVIEEVPQNPGYSQVLIMIAIAILFFYFILWRPEQKRRKGMNQMRTQLSKGDKVTAMGIVGIVAKIQETTIILKMVDGSKIEFLKAAISHVEPSNSKNNSTDEKTVELIPESDTSKT